MVVTQQITIAAFLDLYAKDQVSEVVNVKVGTEQRLYGKTNNCLAADSFKVVYAVVT